MAQPEMHTFTIAQGTALAANAIFAIQLPFGFMPRHISASGSNAHNATIKIGTSSDDDALLAAANIGTSNDPAEFDPDDFVDADYQYTKGDILLVTIDYDGAAGTAIAGLCIAITGLTGA